MIKLTINNKEIAAFNSLELNYDLKSISNNININMPYGENLDDIFNSFIYQRCKVNFNNTLLFDGIIENWQSLTNKDNYILSSLGDLDLSPTMEKNARDKYATLCNYLNNYGLDCDFQPQGSFLIGTAIKPYRDGKDHDYDLDVLAVLNRKKENTDAESVKNDVGNAIKESGVYSDKLEEEDRTPVRRQRPEA